MSGMSRTNLRRIATMMEHGRAADGNEGHLAGDLNAEDEQRAAVDAQSFRGEGEQLGVRRKDSGESLREQHDARPEQRRNRSGWTSSSAKKASLTREAFFAPKL